MDANDDTSDEDNNGGRHQGHPGGHPGAASLAPDSVFHNPEDLVQFVLSGLYARGLKKGIFFAPDPYVKFKIGPGILSRISLRLDLLIWFYFRVSGSQLHLSTASWTELPDDGGRQHLRARVARSAVHLRGLLVRRPGDRGQGQVCQIEAYHLEVPRQAKDLVIIADEASGRRVSPGIF